MKFPCPYDLYTHIRRSRSADLARASNSLLIWPGAAWNDRKAKASTRAERSDDHGSDGDESTDEPYPGRGRRSRRRRRRPGDQ